MEEPAKGKLIMENGVYEGDVVNYEPHGKGKKTFDDGSAYEGEWENGLPNGKGIYLFSCGHIYKGDFINGEMTGKGKTKYASDDVCSYEGDYVNGKPHGIGKMIFSSGNICEGEFENGAPCGQTHWIFPNGLDIEDDENEETDSGSESDDDLNDSIDPDDYDIVVNTKDEIMIVLYEREGEPSSPQAFRTADGDILLKRNQDSLILFDSLPPETFEYFTKVSAILVNEIDDEGLSVHVYDVPLSDQP